MNRIRKINRRLTTALGPALIAAAFAYFGYHAIEGRHGLIALRAYEAAIPELEARAGALAHRRAALERHVALLDAKHVDPDYLDELVRSRLGFVHPDELVVPLPESFGR